MAIDDLPRRFATVAAYNSAYPECALPMDVTVRNSQRAYHAAMVGVADDVTGTNVSLTIEFLPGGAPAPGEADRVGTVVATHWGRGPLIVLAEDVSLRAAWKAVTAQFPTQLSQVCSLVMPLPRSVPVD
ncbi:hypothetical protein [Actinokineospora sp. UTMC 2448]|uniref:hypothetical protein n=1 Tax=Actinokineospora sp. UTMC 2448 TaxID=2268449 RepID=UPI002164E5A8|nr:hypothetical protein [Actinokineospora sp. UTMC 2448]UVS79882.1 hypothetical protein Actkin_03632 [Actinokineospora sp. UTMC 2448]